MPRLRTILAMCILLLLLSVGATALLSSVQRLQGEATLDRGVQPERVVLRVRQHTPPARQRRAMRDTQPEAGGARAAEPRVRYAPAPDYPIQALREQRQGLVVVRVQLSPDGDVREAAVRRSSGDPELDRAALRAVRRWTFDMPRNAKREMLLPIRFHIDAPHP